MHPSPFPKTSPPRLAAPAGGIRVTFDGSVSMDEAADTFDLAWLAAKSLHGDEQVELDARWSLDLGARSVSIDTDTPAGRTLALIFLGYTRREFGSRAVRVQRLNGPRHAARAEQIAGAA